MPQKQTELAQFKSEAPQVLPVFPTQLGNMAAALLLAGLLMMSCLRGSAIAQSTPVIAGSFKIVPLTVPLSGGSSTSSLLGGTFGWSANGLLPARDWSFSNVVIGGDWGHRAHCHECAWL